MSDRPDYSSSDIGFRDPFDAGDIIINDLVIDGQWHDLNLTDKFPAGVKSILFSNSLQADTVGKRIRYRPKGWTGLSEPEQHRIIVANVRHYRNILCQVDDNGLFQYNIDSSGVTWNNCGITVTAWFW